MNDEHLKNLLREVQKLHTRNELSKTVGPDYFEPGMMEYLDQSDGCYDEEAGTLTLRFDSRGTRYEGRTEAIEGISVGTPVHIVRDRENPFNVNNFTMVAANGKNIGHMPAELCNVIAPLFDEGYLTLQKAEVSFVEPLSQRSRYAKQAILFVALTAHLNREGKQGNSGESTAETDAEVCIISALQNLFPDRVVFREQNYRKVLGGEVHYGLYKLAKTAEITVPQWLEQHGFQWKETGFVEDDMKQQDELSVVSTNAFALSDSILRKYPLIGQFEPNETEFNILFATATDCVMKMSRSGAALSKEEAAVLTVATVQLLKKRDSMEEDDSQDSTLWQFVYQQYGFNPENSPAAKQRVYKNFCDAIKGTLEQYHRYFAPSGTMRYYTSLLLHAIAPGESIETLLDILFDFYVKNLDFQYVSDDISYKMMVDGMRARWTSASSDVKLMSKAVSSSLKTLFLERPGYMAVLCDRLTCNIDRLLRGDSIGMEDRWDRLTVDWYEKKSSTERSMLRGQKREHRSEFIATTRERIVVQYQLVKNKVGLSVPQIRLSAEGDMRPVLTLWQHDKCIYQSSLSVIGNDLVLTTRKIFIPLESTSFDFSAGLDLRAEIEYLDEMIYNSAEKLHRMVIHFDQAGNERVVKSGIAYLFATDSQEFVFADESGVTMEGDGQSGQLYRVNLGIVGSVTVNGTELFADEEQANKPRIYPSIRPVQGLELNSDGRNYLVFSRSFSLQIHIPETENPLRYQLTLDGRRIEAQGDKNERHLAADMPDTPEILHTVRLIDMLQSLSVIEYSFIILPDVAWQTEKPWYLETENEVRLKLKLQGREITCDAFREPESSVGIAQSSSAPYSYVFEIPTVSCRIGDQSAFLLPKKTWFESIGKEDFIRLSLPSGWQGQPMIGVSAVPENAENCFEIGNYLYGTRFQASELLWLSLTGKDQKAEKQFLSELCFEPTFSEAPLEVQEDDVRWRPEAKYMGSSDPRFRLEISKFEESFNLALEEICLFKTKERKNGKYHYRIYLLGKGVFAKGQEKLIYESDFILGGENYARFDGCELVLKDAIYWEFEAEELRRKEAENGAGILTDLEYLGESIPSGETLPLPQYRATMYFETYDGRRIRLNSDENNTAFAVINPVSVWIVNDRNMILQDPYEAGLDFDIGTGKIITKNVNYIMSRSAQEKRLRTPDYFGYEMRKRKYV